MRANSPKTWLPLSLGWVWALFFFFPAPPVQAQVYDLVVAKDGSGNHQTIQAALERVAANKNERTLIFVKDGIYEEKVWIYANRKLVSLIGESQEGTIISWNDYSGKVAGMSTATSFTLLAEGDDFYMENITVRNTAGNVGQAVAIRTAGDRQVFKNCRFLGFQDTYYAHKARQYNLDCYVEGATDFIFGDATTVFENSTINCVKGGQYITAHNDTKLISTIPPSTPFYHGLLFLNSTITANADVPANSYYLGRPWGAPGSTVFINTVLGNHIRPEGWSVWSGNNHLSGTFAEYQSKTPGGDLINVGQRVSWSTQLTAEQVAAYYNLDYFLKKSDVVWNPRAQTTGLPAPTGLAANATTLTWGAVDGAKGYVVLRNDEVIGFSATPTFSDAAPDPSIAQTYKVQAVSANGNLSAPSVAVVVAATVTGLKQGKKSAFKVTVADSMIQVSEKVDVEVYTLTGALVKKEKNTNTLSLRGVGNGPYVVKLVNRKGETVVKKFAIR